MKAVLCTFACIVAVLALASSVSANPSGAPVCQVYPDNSVLLAAVNMNRSSELRVPSPNGWSVVSADNKTKLVANETYSFSVQKSTNASQQFRGILIWVQDPATGTTVTNETRFGTFVDLAAGNMAGFRRPNNVNCSSNTTATAVTHSSTAVKNQTLVFKWQAPATITANLTVHAFLVEHCLTNLSIRCSGVYYFAVPLSLNTVESNSGDSSTSAAATVQASFALLLVALVAVFNF